MTKSGDFRIEEAGATELLVEVGDAANLPTKFVLQQNYPNPFNPATTIQYSLPGQYWVSLKVYNMLGEEVADVVEDQKEQGTYEATWNANDKPSGVYTYRLIAFDLSNRSKEAFIQVKKMLLLK